MHTKQWESISSCHHQSGQFSFSFSQFGVYICVIYIYTFTASTPLRKDTGVFESFGRFIGLRCHNYALYFSFVYE